MFLQWQNVPAQSKSKIVGTPSRKNTTTERQMNRIKLIMEMVKESVVVDDVAKIHRYIINKEIEEGLTAKCDKKSISRIFDKLSEAGKIKIIKTIIDFGINGKPNTFICLPHITENHPAIKTAIEKIKQKLEFVPHHSGEKDNVEDTNHDNTIKKSLSEMTQIGSKIKSPLKLNYSNKKKGNEYGYKPKFVRARELHCFLFYLTRDFTGQEYSKDVLLEDVKRQAINFTDEIEAELDSMKIFQPDLNWKTFINPLPKHSGYSEGWILLCDAILRMPLSLFIQLVCINYDVPGLGMFSNVAFYILLFVNYYF